MEEGQNEENNFRIMVPFKQRLPSLSHVTLLCDTVRGLASLKPFSLCIYQLDRLADTFHPQANYVENHIWGLLLLCYFIEKRWMDWLY